MGRQSSKATQVTIFGTDRKHSQGGVATVLNLIASLCDDGVNLNFVATSKSGGVLKKALCFVRSLNSAGHDVIDVAHVHGSSRSSFFRKALLIALLRARNIPVIFHLHGAQFHLFLKHNFFAARLFHWVAQNCHVIVLGQEWKARLADYLIPHQTTCLPNPTDNSLEFVQRKKIRKILFAGRLESRKGVYDLIEAWRLCSGKCNFELLLAGDGEVEKCRRIIEETAIPNVKILGWLDRSRMQEQFKNCDALILPSYDEGLPMSVLEAAQSGMLIMCSPVGSIPEYFDSECSLVIKAGSVAQISQALTTAFDMQAQDIARLTNQAYLNVRPLQLDAYHRTITELYLKLHS